MFIELLFHWLLDKKRIVWVEWIGTFLFFLFGIYLVCNVGILTAICYFMVLNFNFFSAIAWYVRRYK